LQVELGGGVLDGASLSALADSAAATSIDARCVTWDNVLNGPGSRRAGDDHGQYEPSEKTLSPDGLLDERGSYHDHSGCVTFSGS